MFESPQIQCISCLLSRYDKETNRSLFFEVFEASKSIEEHFEDNLDNPILPEFANQPKCTV